MTSKHSIDGFIPRRPGSQLGEHHEGRASQPKAAAGLDRSIAPRVRQQSAQASRQGIGIARSDISESLRGIDKIEEPTGKGSDKKTNKGRKKGAPKSKKRRIIQWVIIALVVIMLAVGGWVLYKGLNATGNIFKGNIFDIIQNQPLKQDANGRSNILVYGTSEDDPGHDGADLTDSIMVISVDQNKKNSYLISIPRDLYVDYGEACPEGFKGRINSMYSCFAGANDNQAEGAEALKAKVGEVLGLDIQYYAHLNYTALREAVDAVGGVDVTIESEDPRGILDRNFDWKCNYKCYFVNYKNGEVAHMDGEHALAFSRARNAAGGYGLPGGNFDREKNQQKVIKALREKAVSVGTLANVGKVTSLIDALGNNLRTNFETKEIRTLMSLGGEIKTESIQSVSLVEEGNMLVTTGNVNGASIVRPIAGLLNYTEIQKYVKKILNANDVTREAAKVEVYNGSGVTGVGKREADKLSEQGFNISTIGDAPEAEYADVEVYQITEGKPATKAKLESLFGVQAKTTPPPVVTDEGANFVVIFGKDRSTSNQ